MTAVDRRNTDVLNTDVLVVGGGAAGVSTATTAARQGLHVILVERYGFCGGGAVAGLSGTVCGLYEATDTPGNRPSQVVFGFTDEFVRRMEEAGGLSEPVRYGKTWTRVHDPLVWREVADGFVARENLRVIYHAVATSVLMEGDERVDGAMLALAERVSAPVDAWSRPRTLGALERLLTTLEGVP